jgi:hypothetical protein
MARGADARSGIYPYREATTAHAIAVERGYAEIVEIIELEEQRRRNAAAGTPHASQAADLFRAIAAGDADRAIAVMDREAGAIHARHLPSMATPLHAAAHALDARLVSWLLDRGADPEVRTADGLTPLDLAAHRWYRTHTETVEQLAAVLLGGGASLTASAAAALGDVDWLRHGTQQAR